MFMKKREAEEIYLISRFTESVRNIGWETLGELGSVLDQEERIKLDEPVTFQP
jgi:hypothetical protein